MKEYYCILIDDICPRASVKPHFSSRRYSHLSVDRFLEGPCGQGSYSTGRDTNPVRLTQPCKDAIKYLRRQLKSKTDQSTVFEFRSDLFQVTAYLGNTPIGRIKAGKYKEIDNSSKD